MLQDGVAAGVAAGHPATVVAGIEILEEGGSAADAAVAASFASCVAETLMTGLLGGALPTDQSQYLPSLVFGLVILVLLIRPAGLFAKGGTQVERV